MTFFKNEILNNNLKILHDNITKYPELNKIWNITYVLSELLTGQIKEGLIKADDPELKAHYDFLINKHGRVFFTHNLIRNLNGGCIFWLYFELGTSFHAIPWHTESDKEKYFFENRDCGKPFTIDLEDLDDYCVVPEYFYKKNIFKKSTNKN
jgi:hypothetical protein